MEKDMTVGSPRGMIVSFTIPVFLGNVFQQFYSMADTIIVGKFVGTKALAAVGSVGTIMFLLIGFLMGMTVGFTVLTSQRYGAKDMRGMRKTVGSAYILSIFVSVVMTVLSMLFMKPLLTLMNTPADIFEAAMIGTMYSLMAAVFFIFVGKYLVYLFVSDNVTEIMGYADIYLRCTAAFLIPLTIVNSFRNGIQGMGYGLLPMMAGVAELIGRGVTALAASRYRSFFGVCMASPAAWILAGSLLLFMYFMIMKRHPKDVE